MLAEVVLAYIHFLFFYVVFAAQICVPRQTRTPAFISLLQELEHRVSGKILARKFYFAGPPRQIDRAAITTRSATRHYDCRIGASFTRDIRPHCSCLVPQGKSPRRPGAMSRSNRPQTPGRDCLQPRTLPPKLSCPGTVGGALPEPGRFQGRHRRPEQLFELG